MKESKCSILVPILFGAAIGVCLYLLTKQAPTEEKIVGIKIIPKDGGEPQELDLTDDEEE